jgi:hypothetical protein
VWKVKLDKASFDRIQEMRKMRSNIEVDGQGNKIRKSTHYSMKLALDMVEDPIQPDDEGV